MRKVAIFVGILGLIALLSLGPRFLPGRPSSFNFGRVKQGMTPERVRSIMGKPSRVAYPSEGGAMWLEWSDGFDFYSVRFRGQSEVEKNHSQYHTPG